MLSKAQKRAYRKLTVNWQSARTLHERLSTLNVLVDMGLAERDYNVDSHFADVVRNKYRLPQQVYQFCANDIMDVLADSFPEWTWTVRQGSLIFTIMAKSGIVSYPLNVPCAELRTDADIKQAGREAVAGLKEALWRHGEKP